jgi:hypothetical protein
MMLAVVAAANGQAGGRGTGENWQHQQPTEHGDENSGKKTTHQTC